MNMKVIFAVIMNTTSAVVKRRPEKNCLLVSSVGRALHRYRLNTVECVIPRHGKAPQFSGVKQLLHGVCWSLQAISLAMSTYFVVTMDNGEAEVMGQQRELSE